MKTIILILLIIAVIGTVGSLATGIGGFAGGGAFNRKYGNLLMRLRIIFQLAAVILFALLMVLIGADG